MTLRLTKTDQQKLKKLGVSTLYLFGSHAQGTSGPTSDLDFAILLHDSLRVKPGNDTLPLYQKLYDFLSDFIPPGRNEPTTIDIVFLQSGVSLELQANVVKYGKILFDDDPRQRADYEAQVMNRMADLRPLLNIMSQAILERI